MDIVKRALRTLRDSAAETRRHVRAVREAWRLSRRRAADTRAQAAVFRVIGERASGSEVGRKRKSYGSVKDREALVADRRATLDDRQRTEATARERLAECTRVRTGEISTLAAEAARRSDAHAAARQEMARAMDAIAEADRDLALPPERRVGRPPRTDIERTLAGHRARLPGLVAEESRARESSEAGGAALRREKRAWKDEEDRLEGEVRASVQAVRLAERAVEEAREVLGDAREDLGRSVHLAGFDAPEIKDQLRRANELSRAIRDAEVAIRERRAIAAATRGTARWFLLASGGALLILVVLLVQLRGGSGEKGSAARPDRAEIPRPPGDSQAGEGSRPPGTTRPAEPRPPGDPAPAGLTPEVRDAVLAHPALAPREADGVPIFRPTGEVSVVSEEPGAGGTRRLVVEAGAERRLDPDGDLSPGTLRLAVTVDARGRVIRTEIRGTTGAGDVELERLLEEWR